MHLADCHNLHDFRELARRRLPRPIFDYIDGAADDEVTYRRSTASFEQCDLVPSILRGVAAVDLSVTVLGRRLAIPGGLLRPQSACDPPEARCNNHRSANMQAYAKQRIKALHFDGKGKVRINKAGCLDRCDEGSVLVVYPDAVRYTYVDKHDIDEIIDSHIVHGRLVERLQI